MPFMCLKNIEKVDKEDYSKISAPKKISAITCILVLFMV
jgi:hypothetical protein